MASKLLTQLIEVKEIMAKRCNIIEFDGAECFLTDDGVVFNINALEGFNALVVESADSIEEANKYNLEDGEMYSVGKYSSQEIADYILEDLKAS